MSEIKKQLPNILTMLRILLAILCSYYAYEIKINSLVISLVLFAVASVTDYFDGYIARKWKIVSSFGKLMDPIADKILILGVLFAFAFNGVVPLLFAILISFREILLTVIRLLISSRIVLAARYSGKVKTFSQMIVLVLIYLSLIYKREIIQHINHITLSYIVIGLITWVTAITIYSGYDFLYHNRKIMKKELGISM